MTLPDSDPEIRGGGAAPAPWVPPLDPKSAGKNAALARPGETRT